MKLEKDLFEDANMFRKILEDDLTSLNSKTGHLYQLLRATALARVLHHFDSSHVSHSQHFNSTVKYFREPLIQTRYCETLFQK